MAMYCAVCQDDGKSHQECGTKLDLSHASVDCVVDRMSRYCRRSWQLLYIDARIDEPLVHAARSRILCILYLRLLLGNHGVDFFLRSSLALLHTLGAVQVGPKRRLHEDGDAPGESADVGSTVGGDVQRAGTSGDRGCGDAHKQLQRQEDAKDSDSTALFLVVQHLPFVHPPNPVIVTSDGDKLDEGTRRQDPPCCLGDVDHAKDIASGTADVGKAHCLKLLRRGQLAAEYLPRSWAHTFDEAERPCVNRAGPGQQHQGDQSQRGGSGHTSRPLRREEIALRHLLAVGWRQVDQGASFSARVLLHLH
mmetsp:Transcript_29038/g.69139  ORF Transcript_29038/g.69139 Transcript_29038/m.69139 type:complete len:307 (+) Transcript_29038:365-1285(+)